MSISSQLIQRVENAVYHEPYMIPTLFRDSKVKKGFIHSRLRRYVPHRVGIEFECFGDLVNGAIGDGSNSWKTWEDVERYYGITDFSQDRNIMRPDDSIKNRDALSEINNEIRVSISDYRQLNGLYNILRDMSKYCFISPDCGIHIHVDLTKYGESYQKELAVNWFNRHLHEVESIFPPYKGSYNKRIAQRGKGSWINLSMHDTVEFRIAPLTFDYEMLIIWIVKCSKLVSQMILECHLSRKPQKVNKRTNEYITLDEIVQERDNWTYWSNSNLNDRLDSLSNQVNQLRDQLNHANVVNNDGVIERDCEITREAFNHAILNQLLNALNREDIDYYIQGDVLNMEFPDGIRVSIQVEQAVGSYLDGGLTDVMRDAHVLRSSSTRYHRSEGGTYSSRWIGYSDQAYYTA